MRKRKSLEPPPIPVAPAQRRMRVSPTNKPLSSEYSSSRVSSPSVASRPRSIASFFNGIEHQASSRSAHLSVRHSSANNSPPVHQRTDQSAQVSWTQAPPRSPFQGSGESHEEDRSRLGSEHLGPLFPKGFFDLPSGGDDDRDIPADHVRHSGSDPATLRSDGNLVHVISDDDDDDVGGGGGGDSGDNYDADHSDASWIDQEDGDLSSSSASAVEDWTKERKVEATADAVLQLFNLETFGCGREQHQLDDAQHREAMLGEKCNGLLATYKTSASFVNKSITLTSGVGLENLTFPKPAEVSRGGLIKASRIRRLMEGHSSDENTPRHVCLHHEERPPTAPRYVFDTDGVIAFTDKLTGINTTLQTVFTQVDVHNVTTDIHVKYRVHRRNGRGDVVQMSAQLKDLPHLWIGTIPELNRAHVFRVFPLLYTQPGANRLTSRNAMRYLNNVWTPALNAASRDGRQQYYPPNAEVANLKSQARLKEHRSGKETGARSVKFFPLMPDTFAAIEREISSIVDDPNRGMADFAHSFLVVNAKNTKLDFRAPNLWQAMEAFDSVIARVFDVQRVNVVSDIAFECLPASEATLRAESDDADAIVDDVGITLPPDQPLTSFDSPRGGQPVVPESSHSSPSLDGGSSSAPVHVARPAVYLWKACCLRRMVKQLQATVFNGGHGAVQEFHNVYLRDSTCVTVIPPTKSVAHAAGLYYVQGYIVEKAFEDANSIHPFDIADIVNLAVPNDLYRTAPFPRDRGALEKNYLESKRRLSATFNSYSKVSTGCRLEIRVDSQLRAAIKEKAWRREHPFSRDLDFLWVLPTDQWLDFKRGNFDKITALIDLIILFSPETGVTKGSAQLLFALLTYLQNLSNSNPRAKSLLWTTSRVSDAGTRYGLGLSESIKQYGFGWIQSIVDWERFCFQTPADNHMLRMDEVIGVCYNDRASVRLHQSQQEIMDVCLEALRESAPKSDHEKHVFRVMADFILRSYRRDIWAIFCLTGRNEVRQEFRHPDALDDIQFSWESLCQVLVQTPVLIAGNRSGADCGPQKVFEWIMTNKGGHKRTHIDGDGANRKMKPYRRALRRVWTVTDQTPGRTKRWEAELRRVCKKYIWLFPQPDTNGALASCGKGRQGRHVFMSIVLDEDGQWGWGRKQCRPGVPPPWPPTLAMSTEEITAYLASKLTPSSVVDEHVRTTHTTHVDPAVAARARVNPWLPSVGRRPARSGMQGPLMQLGA